MQYGVIIAMRERRERLEVLLDEGRALLPYRRDEGDEGEEGIPLTLRMHEGTPLSPQLIWCRSGPRAHHGHNCHWVAVGDVEELPGPDGAVLCEALAKFWPILPLSNRDLSSQYALHPELAVSQQLTFYGGTFDPFHQGHLSCIRLAPASAHPLIVVPDYNPQKQRRRRRSYWQLYRQLQQAIQGREGVYLYPGFCGIPHPNPTITWLRQVGAGKGLLLGDDSFGNLLEWQDGERLVGLLERIYVVPRSPWSERRFDAQVEKLRTYNPHLGVECLSRHRYEELSSSRSKS